jgi:hypothetical protein
VAVLKFNDGHGWIPGAYDELREKYGWPVLDQRAREHLLNMFERVDGLRIQRRDP